MKLLRAFFLLTALLSLASCQMIRAPFDMAGRLLGAGARSLHLSSQGNAAPEDFQIDAATVREALASAPRPAENLGEVENAASAVALR